MKTVDGFFLMLILMEKRREEQTKIIWIPVGCQDFCTAIYCKLVASEKELNGNGKMKCYNTSNGYM
ncbi:MAG: hypothetical protein ACI4TK_03860 [Agathobacter sp.]